MNTNREILEGALKRVSALAGVEGKLYKDTIGWSVIWKGHEFDESARSAGDLLSYLHGIEDMYLHTRRLLADNERRTMFIDAITKEI